MSSVQLYHGDCLEYMRTMADGSVDAVVTDPPYGMLINPLAD
jgi:DNA modification methylase